RWRVRAGTSFGISSAISSGGQSDLFQFAEGDLMSAQTTPTLDPSELSLADLRAERATLQAADDAVSYVRRLVQARLDMVELERKHRLAGTQFNVDEDLPAVLGRHLTGGPARPPRPTADASDHPLAIELDELCRRLGADRLDELSDEQLDAVATELASFEQERSHERQVDKRFGRLDALSAELVRRYRDGEASVDGLLADD
ncbi:MAG TPA: hypothetical protein PLV68_05015, partial [Ilumatobacteraceae bacterium]|nr:hypothetical protein [Ilumatobacteraceae bacterium]